MNNKHVAILAQIVLLLALSVGSVVARAQGGLVQVDGSSTVFPITEAVAEDFQRANKGMRVTVGVSGTGGGFKKFCRGEIDVVNASRPISKQEMAACKKAGVNYIELPIAYDALTVVVNPKNDWVKEMTVQELKKMWEPAAQAKVTRWNQVNEKWPNAPLALYGPGADSGTFDYFTEAVVGKAKSSRGDFTASEDDNVLVQGVAQDKNALGYFGFAYYLENQKRLKAVPIVNPKTGKAVLPSAKTIESGTYAPLSRPIFIYVNAKSAAKPEVKQFVEFYLENAPELAQEVGYVPLPKKAYELAIKHFQNKKLGTAFSGESGVGISAEELLKRESKN